VLSYYERLIYERQLIEREGAAPDGAGGAERSALGV
jgi:hypothetical protein